MKKALSIFLILVMLFSLAACGGDNTPETTATQDASASSTEETLQEENAVVDTLHEHVYTPVVTAPTCTEDGYTTCSCACGESYISDKVIAAGHAFGDWTTTQPATEEATGTAERKCESCQATETKTLGKLIPNHTHSYTTKVTAEATCTKEGAKILTCACGESYSEKIIKQPHKYKDTVVSSDCVNGGHTSHKCAVCGDAFVDTYTAALGHNYTEKVISSTCVSRGQKTGTCTRCGSTYREKLPKGEHRFSPATCTQAKSCTVCGKVEGTALGHSYSNGACSRCGAQDPAQQTGPVNFSVTVRSDKGKLISGVSVKVYVEDVLVGSGTTDGSGAVKLQLSKSGSSYRILLADVPEAYEAKESYTFSSTTVNINLTTVPVLDPNDHSLAMYKVGSTMANFVLTDTEGKVYDLSQLRQEKKLIILDFWYVTCAPCKAEFPYFEKALEQYGDEITLLALNPVDGENSIKALRQELEVTFPMIKESIGLAQGFDVTAYPTTVFIDSDGKVVFIEEGQFSSEQAFLKTVANYL